MPIPLKCTIFDPGLGGAPTQTNPRDLSGWATSYDDSQLTGFGHDALRISGFVQSREEAANWAARLMSSVEVYTPERTAPRFTGFLNGVKIPGLESNVSLTNMANVIIARWGAPDGTQGTVSVSNAASIARYGRKERVLNESISLQADATNRATMILTQVSDPLNNAPVSVEKEDGALFEVELTFCGWAETLKWLTTSNTTETTQASTTQVPALIAAYNAVNAFFDTAGSAISAIGHAATQFCPPDTTYFGRIEKLLSFGDTAQRRLTWGFYGRAITIAVAACATPDTITYNYSKRAGKLWDVNKNFIEPWDWAPDCMTQNVDVIGPEPPSGAIASLTRKYMRRATLSIGADGIPHGQLDPDDVDKLAEYVAYPVSKSTGISARHQYTDERIRDAMGPRTIRTDNNNLWNPSTGVLREGAGGTGISNGGTIDTGGGNWSNTGGSNVDFGTGSGLGGAGSSGVSTGGGTIGALAKWATASTLTNAVSGTDYAPAHGHPYAASVHTHTTGDVTGGIDGSGAAGRVAYWSDANTLTSSADLTYPSAGGNLFLGGSDCGVVLEERDGAGQWTLYATGGLFRVFDGSGDVVNIDTNGVITSVADTIVLGAFTLNLDGSLRASGAGAATGEALIFNGTAFIPTAIDAAPSDAKYIVQQAHAGLSAEQALSSLATGVMKVTTSTGVVSSMTGTTGRITEWEDGTTIGPSTLIKTGAGVTTIDSASTITLDLDGSSGNVLRHNGTNWVAAALATTDLSNFNEAVDDRVDALLVAGTNITLTYNDASNTLTVASTASGAIDGSGAANRVAYWSDADTLTSDADLTFNGTTLTAGPITTTGASSGLTLNERDGSGTWAIYATGGQLRMWDGAADVVTIDGNGSIYAGDIVVDAALHSLGGYVTTGNGVSWDLGGYVAGTPGADTGVLFVNVAGVEYQIRVHRT